MNSGLETNTQNSIYISVLFGGQISDLCAFLVPSIRSVMQKYLEERDELAFDKIFNQKIGKCTLNFVHNVFLLKPFYSLLLFFMLGMIHLLNGKMKVLWKIPEKI